MSKSRISSGRVYDPDIFDEPRPIIEPFKDMWDDPDIITGPPPFFRPNTNPPLLPHPIKQSHMDGSVMKETLPYEAVHQVDLTRGADAMPEPIKTYVRRIMLDLTKWMQTNVKGLMNESDGHLNGSKLESTLALSTNAIQMNLMNKNYTAIDRLLDDSHDSITPALTDYTILIASKQGDIKGVNKMANRMPSDRYSVVVDEVTSNIVAAVEHVPNQNIKEDMGEWVEKMDEYPTWSSKAMLNLPDEYKPGDKISSLLKSSLGISDPLRNEDGSRVTGSLDAVSDTADVMTGFQVTAAIIE